jgi:hypothetical protein
MGNPTRSLAIAALLIFITLSIPTAFAAHRHGLRTVAIVGWGYLFLFCSFKIIASGMELADSHSTGAMILSNIGLSPLLMATAGILHEM